MEDIFNGGGGILLTGVLCLLGEGGGFAEASSGEEKGAMMSIPVRLEGDFASSRKGATDEDIWGNLETEDEDTPIDFSSSSSSVKVDCSWSSQGRSWVLPRPHT